MTIAVFVGPTLPGLDGAELGPDVVVRPPVKRGDVYRAVNDGATRIAIIDGYFDSVPSVWHKEILWALSTGAVVGGAASMGALRAAELHGHGMVGVGQVFEAYRSGALTDDDEVTVIHAPAELGYAPMSVALVNIRATLAAARDAGVIGGVGHDRLVAAAKALHYQDRTYAAVLAHAADEPDATRDVEALAAWLPGNEVDQKALDARLLLAALPDLAPPTPPPPFTPTVYWERLVQEAGAEQSAGNVAAVLNELRLRGPGFQQLMTEGLLRVLSRREAARLSLSSPTALAQVQERLYEIHGLVDEERRAAWMRANGLTSEAELARMVAGETDSVLVAMWFRDEVRRAVVDVLRARGLLSAVLARARDKQAVLAAGHVVAVDDDAALRWFFSQPGRPPPPDIVHYAHASGFDDVAGLARAVREEFVYCHARLGRARPGQEGD